MIPKESQCTIFVISGIAAVVLFFIVILLATDANPSWRIGIDTFSELGGAEMNSKEFFNYGSMVFGTLLAVFGIGNAIHGRYRPYRIGGILIAVAGISFAGVGIFPYDINHDLHNIVTASLCIFAILSLIAFIIGHWIHKRTSLTVISVAVLIIVLASLFFGFSVFEAFTISFMLFWILIEDWELSRTYRNTCGIHIE